VDRLRDEASAPSQEKENEIYALDRRATLSETKNKGKEGLQPHAKTQHRQLNEEEYESREARR
jgi:hypothetical protein